MQPDGIRVFFLEEGAQAATDVAARLADFIHAAQHTLDIAIYDFRLSDPQRDIITKALAERAAEGVQIRIAYDADKPAEPHAMGVDPAPSGTGSFVQSLGYPWRRIGGMKLMHNKYLVRDAGTLAGAVWTGSLNFTDDAWTLQENNVLQLASANLTALYAEDFAELWDNGTISHTGDFDTPPVALAYAGQPAGVQVMFSPGRGQTIDYLIALRVAQAQRHVRICSMLLNSGALLSVL